MNISHLCTWPLPSKTVNTGKLSPLPPTRMWIDPPASNSHKWRSIGINNPGAACYLLLVGYIDPNTPKSSKKLEEQDSHLTGKCCDVTKKTSRFGGYDISHKKNTWEIRKIRFTKCSTTGVRISNIYIYIYMSCRAWRGNTCGWCCHTVTDYSELSEAFTISTDHPFFVSATTKMPMNSTNHLESRFGVIGLSVYHVPFTQPPFGSGYPPGN